MSLLDISIFDMSMPDMPIEGISIPAIDIPFIMAIPDALPPLIVMPIMPVG